MVKLSDLVRAAESADQALIEQAYAVLSNAGPKKVSTAKAVELLGVSRRSILRHGKPVEKFAGQNFYDLNQLREALTR